MASLNRVEIIGYLGADPEMRTMPNGDAVVNISVATAEKWKDKVTGESKERTDWHRIIFFRRQAEIASQYLRKGALVRIDGTLRYRKWIDSENKEHWTTEIHASNLMMLDRLQSNTQTEHQVNSKNTPSTQDNSGKSPNNLEFDDDIPI